MPREVLGRGPGPPLAAAEDGVRLQSRVQLLDGQLGQYLIGTPACQPHFYCACGIRSQGNLLGACCICERCLVHYETTSLNQPFCSACRIQAQRKAFTAWLTLHMSLSNDPVGFAEAEGD